MLAKYGKKRLVNLEKRDKTNMEKYGAITPLQNENIKKKIIENNLYKYGVKYPIMSEVVQLKCKESREHRTPERKAEISKKLSKIMKERWDSWSTEKKQKAYDISTI